MMNFTSLAIKFAWPVYPSYAIEEAPEPTGDSLLSRASSGPRLVALGEPLIARPLENFPDLFLSLASLDPTPTNCRDFACRHGLLTNMVEEPLSVWGQLCNSMKELLSRLEAKSNWEVRDGQYLPMSFDRAINLQFEPDPDPRSNRLLLSVSPISLNSAMRLQCLSHFSAGGSTRPCDRCGNPIKIGGIDGRRSHIRFCNETCRSDYHHQLRRRR